MATISIDTHSAYERLTASGFPKQQAEAVVETLKEATLSNVATREDVQKLENQILHAKVELLRWLVPLLIGQVAIFVALSKWIG